MSDIAKRLREIHSKASALRIERPQQPESNWCSVVDSIDALPEIADVIEAAGEMRIYCLGTDCSTRNTMERFDAALDALARKLEKS